MVVNDSFVARAFGVPSRKDCMPGLGPLGGLITALEWATDLRLGGAFILGCDMPLVNAGIVGRILRLPRSRKKARVPASRGPLGMEPLCAAYDVECLGPARELVRSGTRSMRGLLDTLDFDLVPLEEMGDPEEVARAFTNVNTVSEGRRIDEVFRARAMGPSRAGRAEDGRDGR
jgi:molybdopterin-guanine dinucleotide biosynthesis protein A